MTADSRQPTADSRQPAAARRPRGGPSRRSPRARWAEDTAAALGRTDALNGLRQRYASRTAQISNAYADVLAAARRDATNDGKPANLGPQLFAQRALTQLPAARGGHLFGSVYFLPSGYSGALGALDAALTSPRR